MHCNAGTVRVHQQGYLGSYPRPVWYHPNGITNIMSLFNGKYVNHLFEGMVPEVVFTFLSGKHSATMLTFLTAQMSVKQGLNQFGKTGAGTIMSELEQLIYHKVMEGHKSSHQTREQKQVALKYLMFLKQKQCGKIKCQGCTDGHKQHIYKTKEDKLSHYQCQSPISDLSD